MNRPYPALRRGTLLLALLASLTAALPATHSRAADGTPASVVLAMRQVDLGFPVEAVVEAVRQATVAAQVPGRILEVRADAGQKVKAGQVLVRIDAREAAGADASARAALVQTRAAFERTRSLHAQKFVSKAALDQAEAALKAAEANASSAGAGLSHGTVTAPIAGLVAQRHAEVGEMAVPGKPLLTVFDPRGMRVIANLPHYKLAELRKSPRARIEFPATGRWVDVVRVEILPTLDARSHTATARLYLPDDVADVVPGSYARAHFTTGTANRLTLPPAAVLRRGEVTAVYVLDGKGAARLRQVRLGEPTADGELEVLAGVNPGERVSLTPQKTGIEARAAAPAATR